MNDTTFQGNGSVKYVPVVVDAKPKPITNADRIRSMTDEELARWVTSGIKSVLAICKGYELSPAYEQEMLDWLREVATDG